uniref:Dystroglycan 1 n=1 Tax=Zeugodacus cucurbitae TaxID=28588 RepID=A0A0A1X3Z7_ZEUCU
MRRMPKFDLTLSSKASTLLLLFGLACLASVRAERDFNFNDSQVPLLEPRDEPAHIHYGHDPYSVELSSCRSENSEIVLSLVLKSHDWADLSDNKKDKVLEKLSKFFAIPKEFIVMESATKRELSEMQKESIRRGYNKCHNNNKHPLGRVSFVLGCGAKYFTMSEPLMKQIGAQMKDGSIDNITGEKFGWWVIWRKLYKARAQRKRRQTEGSGVDEAEDGDDYDYDYDDDDDDVVYVSNPIKNESETEVPVTTPPHAHRHHHGDGQSNIEDNKLELSAASTSTATASGSNEDGLLDAVAAASSSAKEPISSDTISDTKHTNIDEEIVESVSQLESVITKTIENTKNIKEIPVLEEDDDEDAPVAVDIAKELDVPNALEEINNGGELDGAENDYDKNVNRQITSNADRETVKVAHSSTTAEIPLHLRNEHGDTDSFDAVEPSADSDSVVAIESSAALSHNSLDRAQTEASLASAFDTTAAVAAAAEFETRTITPVANTLEPAISRVELSKSETTSLLPPALHTPAMNASTTQAPNLFANAVTTSLYASSSSSPSSSSSSSSPSSSSVSSSSLSSSSTPSSATVPTFILSTITTSFATTPTTTTTIKPSFITTPLLTKDDNETNSLLPETDASRTPPTTPQGSDSASSPTSLLTSPTTSTLGTSPTSISTDATAPTLPSTDYVEPKVENTPPMIRTRLQKFAVTSGKAFSYSVPQDTFYDTEDLTNLRLDLTDKDGRELKASSWLQFNPETHVLYGLPLDDSVSKWQYRLTATDSGNESVTETLEISVQQHRGVRTVNHEISITVKINEKNIHNIDWQLKLMRDVASTLGDENTNSLVVREIRPMPQDPNTATFVYFNETFPTSECPEAELNKLVKRLDASRLSDLVYPTLSVKSITGQLIGACQKSHITKPKPTTHMATNVPPLPRNQVDRVNATVGHLLVFKVPSDTFYDPNDNEQLTLTLKTKDHKELNPRHWLQFDSKNQEFYGIPKSGDAGSDEYLLVAQDAGGLSATDALVVVVNHAPKKEFSVYFKAYLAIRHEQFNADLQRKFVERISQLFGDSTTQYVQIRSVTTQHDSDSTIVNFYNTSLYKSHNRCPEEEIEAVRSVYLIKDHMVRDHVKKILGPELNLTNVQALPLGLCHPQTDIIHRDYVPTKPDQPTLKSSFSEEYMYTIILPAVIIVSMILIACLIACCLHRRRRKSGKMELGDEEERRSFRKKNIPVIFQDELDEKPEIGNKSPIILKDEKPPLLPPSYNTSNMNGDNDVDEYVPPPAVVVGGREARGKSPATPSYRKPPPYVSP